MRMSILAGILAIFLVVGCEDDTALISEPESDESEQSETPAEPEVIVLFDSGETSNGNHSFIHQDWCDAAAPSGLTEVYPLNSTTTLDLMDIVPSEYAGLPVEGPTGIEIRESWENIWLAGALNNSLNAAGVTASDWWTGTNGSGQVTSNCNDWTNDTAGVSATYGSSGSTTSTWLFNATTACSVTRAVLCIGW